MKLIETTKAMRDFYEQHLEQLDRMAEMDDKTRQAYFNDSFTARFSKFPPKDYYNCFMCDASTEISPMSTMCANCPLSSSRQNNKVCHAGVRKINLKDTKGNPTEDYGLATPESIAIHADWIADQITKHTDCKMV